MNESLALAGKSPSSERIRQLCQIDQDIIELLKHAGEAIKALTTESSTTTPGSEHPNFDDRRVQFSAAASAYFDKLSSIDVSVRHQILDLKNMDIIPSEDYPKTDLSELEEPAQEEPLDASMVRQKTARKNAITAGGLGNLDIGWLNSRNDNVGKETEASLWQEALQYIHNQTDQPRSPHGDNLSSPGVWAQQQAEPMDQS